MSLKLKCLLHWNVIKTEIFQKLKCYQYWKVTSTKFLTELKSLVFQHYWKRANDSTRLIQQDFRLYQKIPAPCYYRSSCCCWVAPGPPCLLWRPCVVCFVVFFGLGLDIRFVSSVSYFLRPLLYGIFVTGCVCLLCCSWGQVSDQVRF